METDFTEWQAHSPLRRPAWPWLRACWLLEKGIRPNAHFDGDVVRRAKRFLTANGNCVPGPILSQAEEKDPALAEALRLYGAESPDARWRLEAYLLSAEPMEVVASRCSLSPATVQAYHDVFFQVRGRHQEHDWIWRRAIGAGTWDHFAHDYPGCIWKALAYVSGPLALEIAIAVTTDSPFPPWVREQFAGRPAHEEARMRFLGTLVIGSLRAASPEELRPLLEARQQLRILDHVAAGVPDEPEAILAAMEGMLRSLNGQPKPSSKKPSGQPKVPKGSDPGDHARKARRKGSMKDVR